jgi:hypothetical protein
MQRLTRYSLLINAIIKKTTEQEEKKNLEMIVSLISMLSSLFVARIT